MDNVVTKKAVKRFFHVLILLCFCVFMFTGCEAPTEMQIGWQAEKFMKCIANKDKEGLFEYFAQDRRTERKEETMNEINIALDSVIDGNIVSYKYDGDGGGEDGWEYGVITHYSRCPSFCNIKTDTGKTYSIIFSYYHVWKDHPELEGIRYIDIYKDNGYKDYKHLWVIGGRYDPETDECDGLWK